MDGLPAPPHGRREVRSYTANRRELRLGVVGAKAASGLVYNLCGLDRHNNRKQNSKGSKTFLTARNQTLQEQFMRKSSKFLN